MESWRSVTIGEACKLVNGGTPKTKVTEYWDGLHAWIAPAEMGGRDSPYISHTRRNLSDDGLAKCSASLLPPYSVILSSRAPIGHLVVNEVPMATNQGCKGLIPGNGLHHKYLYYYLYSIVDLLNELGTGATFKELSATKLRGVPIVLPPLAEQDRIVAILDEAFAAMATATANAEKNLTNARELFESELNRVFSQKGDGWVEKPLGQVCSIKHGFAFKGEFFADKGYYVVLTPGNFFETGGYRDRCGKTKLYTGEIPPNFILAEGDFLIAMTEQAVGLLGSSMIVPESGRFLHNQRLGLVQIADGTEWHNDFFLHQFNTVEFRAAVQKTASGVKVRHTSPKKLGAIEVTFPPTATEQKRVARRLSQMLARIRGFESICQKKRILLADLKQSILHKAFTGELTTGPDKIIDRTPAAVAVE